MEIIIHIETKKLDKNLLNAIEEYTKRTSPYCKISTKLYKSIEKAQFKASSKLFLVLPGNSSPTSPGLAQLIQNNNLNGISCIEFIILNNYTDSNLIKMQEAFINAEEFNLSSFSMSPDLTTVVLTEQIYRAYTIMNNITYHK